jgi:hypothetical protein
MLRPNTAVEQTGQKRGRPLTLVVRPHWSALRDANVKAYLDNNVVSSIVRDDIESQFDALSRLLEAGDLGKVLLRERNYPVVRDDGCPVSELRKHSKPMH